MIAVFTSSPLLGAADSGGHTVRTPAVAASEVRTRTASLFTTITSSFAMPTDVATWSVVVVLLGLDAMVVAMPGSRFVHPRHSIAGPMSGSVLMVPLGIA